MNDPSIAANLLRELEARQDEVLLKLEELNQRLERTLAEWLRAQAARSAHEQAGLSVARAA